MKKNKDKNSLKRVRYPLATQKTGTTKRKKPSYRVLALELPSYRASKCETDGLRHNGTAIIKKTLSENWPTKKDWYGCIALFYLAVVAKGAIFGRLKADYTLRQKIFVPRWRLWNNISISPNFSDFLEMNCFKIPISLSKHYLKYIFWTECINFAAMCRLKGCWREDNKALNLLLKTFWRAFRQEETLPIHKNNNHEKELCCKSWKSCSFHFKSFYE